MTLESLEHILSDPVLFIEVMSGLRLRSYQVEVARAVVDSVIHGRGLSFVVMFPRQSGKNELQAQIEAYLLARGWNEDTEIVKVSPTWKPQSINAMRRLGRVLEGSPWFQGAWQKENGYIYRAGRARVTFLSGAPESNIVGATASTLLEVDEAQDVSIAKFDREIAPMAASTNATRVFWGTAWTSQTLLARELRAAREAEQRGGPRRAFVLAAGEVAREVPAYGDFVREQVSRLGRTHPSVRTQFFSEEIDAQSGMFPPGRVALMQGQHPAQTHPRPGAVYALLLDVAGEDLGEEGAGDRPMGSGARDATALTVVEVDTSFSSAVAVDTAQSLTDGKGAMGPCTPVYRVAARQVWVGVNHTRLYEEVLALARSWNARQVVVDATGIGAGLASFLDRALPGRVRRFVFSSASKSRLGWDFLGIIDTGRWQEPRAADQEAVLGARFRRELAFCRYEIVSGPGKLLKWGVPDGSRDPSSGERVHDDLVLSAALCAVLDAERWPAATSGALGVIRGRDPLDDMRGF